MEFKPIAYLRNDFPTKFGLPRQSGMAESLVSRVVMEKEYRNPEAFRGIGDFEYIWLLAVFEPVGSRDWSPTVRPHKLGGNKRMGVFATRSPNRPNQIALTRVKLLSVESHPSDGICLTVSGADLMDGTAILDIKPYLPFADSVPDAASGGYGIDDQKLLKVEIPDDIRALFSEEQLAALTEALAFDPRPGYKDDEQRLYGFGYGGYDIKFRVNQGKLTVVAAEPL
jgi:tRNA-Thr(GGU) m(6)t(6)A37 methyltransferase TsaA